jgi:succinate dehydrogenase hydrophobic anchor subunit
MKKTITTIIKSIAVLFLIIALLFAWASLNAFIERTNHGAGLMFADVEIFVILTLFFLFIGILCFWVVKKIKRHKNKMNITSIII